MQIKRMVGAVLLALLLVSGVVLAAGGYDLSWHTVDGGGGTSSGGTYILRGTAGQPDAGTLSGGTYSLAGGFWGAGGPSPTPTATPTATPTNTATPTSTATPTPSSTNSTAWLYLPVIQR